MNSLMIRRLIVEALLEVAPEINEAKIDAEAELREEYDIDSMDFLNFIIALKKQLRRKHSRAGL